MYTPPNMKGNLKNHVPRQTW